MFLREHLLEPLVGVRGRQPSDPTAGNQLGEDTLLTTLFVALQLIQLSTWPREDCRSASNTKPEDTTPTCRVSPLEIKENSCPKSYFII